MLLGIVTVQMVQGNSSWLLRYLTQIQESGQVESVLNMTSMSTLSSGAGTGSQKMRVQSGEQSSQRTVTANRSTHTLWFITLLEVNKFAKQKLETDMYEHLEQPNLDQLFVNQKEYDIQSLISKAVPKSYCFSQLSRLVNYETTSQFANLLSLHYSTLIENAIYSIIPMLSHRTPPPQPRPHLTARPSPTKPHFITLCTPRPTLHLPPQEQNTNRPTVALSPNRNSPKIKLVSPLKMANRSDPTTKENSPTPHTLLKNDQAASPGKPKYIELGGNTQRPLPKNPNEISNISIKHHLGNVKECSPSRITPGKYQAFVIKSHKRTETAQPHQPQKHITINQKHFDISSLQSQVIHVAPFHHIRTPSHALSPVIREETQHSSLRESYLEELRGIQDMRKDLEEQSSRIRETLTASRLDQVCTSRLVETNEEERSQRKSPSKLLNFQDVPLHQSRLKTEEKLHHPLDNCLESRQSQQVVRVVYEQVRNAPSILEQPVVICQSVTPMPVVGITSEKTLINELNFATNNKLMTNPRDEVCVQTDQGSNKARPKLAIFRNQECFIKLGENIPILPLPEIQQGSILEESQNYMAEDSQLVEEGQSSLIKQKQATFTEEVGEKQQPIIQQKSAILNEPKSSQLLALLQDQSKKVVEKQEQPKSYDEVEIKIERHPSSPSICSQTILVPQREVLMSSQDHFRVDSNISLQLQPIPMQKQASNYSQSAISDKKKVKVPKVALQQLSRREEEKPTVLSLQSARSAPGNQAWTKRSVVSKRSIHNSIYL